METKTYSFTKWLTLRTTNICNHNCIFCTQKEFLNKIDYSIFLNYDIHILNDILNILKNDWYDFILISWWEATLNKDIINVINFFYNHWIYVFLMTNWSNLHNIDLDKISKNITFYVSYHGFQDTYELLINKSNIILEINWQKESEFQKVWKNIELLILKGFTVILKVVVNKYNISSLELFIEYLFFKFWEWIGIEITLMEGLENKDIRKLSCNISEFNNLIEILHKKYWNRIMFEWWKICDKDFFMKNHKNIFSSIPNKILWEIKINDKHEILYQKKTEFVWKGNIKKYLNKCKNCNLFNICHWYDIFYLKK